MAATATVILLAAVVLRAGPEGQTLDTLTQIYEKQLREIEAVHGKAQSEALSAYGRALEVALADVKKRGDLEGLIALKDEMDRFAQQNTVPEASSPSPPASLGRVQAAYRSAAAAAIDRMSRGHAAMIDNYIRALDTLKKQHVAAERIEDALGVVRQIEKMEFILADLRSSIQSPKPAPVPRREDARPAFLKDAVLCYRFEGGTGGAVRNEIEGAGRATLHGTTTRVRGKHGDGLQLDGKSGWVSFPVSSSLDLREAATLAAWVKFDALPSSSGRIMSVVGASMKASDLDLQVQQDDRFYFYVANGPKLVSRTSIRKGRWYHVAATYKANAEIRLYVDGRLERTLAIRGERRRSDGKAIGIGESPVWRGRYLAGTLDDVCVHRRALSSAEVSRLYAWHR